jgi:hypothetical protein
MKCFFETYSQEIKETKDIIRNRGPEYEKLFEVRSEAITNKNQIK